MSALASSMRLCDFVSRREKESICLKWANMLNIFKADHKDTWWTHPVHWYDGFVSECRHVIGCHKLIFLTRYFVFLWCDFTADSLKMSFRECDHSYWKIYISPNIVFSNRSWRNRASRKFLSGTGVIDTRRNGKIFFWIC